MNRLRETDSYVDENPLTVNVSRLRKKLEKEITISTENLPQPHKAYFINFILYQIIIFQI